MLTAGKTEPIKSAHDDRLTGIHNRRDLKIVAKVAVEAAMKSEVKLDDLVIDAVDFKPMNDRNGHK